MRDTPIKVRDLSEQGAPIDHAVDLSGKKRSDLKLEAMCESEQSVVLDQVSFGLDSDRFQRFVDLLGEQPKPDVGLQRLITLEPIWGKA